MNNALDTTEPRWLPVNRLSDWADSSPAVKHQEKSDASDDDAVRPPGIEGDMSSAEVVSQDQRGGGSIQVHPAQRIIIAGEAFWLEPDEDSEGGVVIRHPKWSLLGCGRTGIEAEIDLLAEAADLVPVFVHAPLTSLDAEALRLREFIIRTLG